MKVGDMKRPSKSDPTAALEAVQRGDATLSQIAHSADSCRACDLWKRATQTVFGEGSSDAEVVFVGEQPGNEEDLQGRPFVGPAGRLLEKALAAAGIDRKQVYLTNVVKHFSWENRGKWRIHKKPKPDQIRACRPWLLAELAALEPRVVVCLGATASQALLGSSFRVTRDRGKFVDSEIAPYVMATIHPSAILRSPDDATRHSEYARFVSDLRNVVRVISGRRSRRAG
jgi:DNA polymerase